MPATRLGYRQGRFSYAIPLPAGRWKVTLLFVDPRTKASAPWRFDVRANGATVLDDLDVRKVAGGALRGVTRQFTARSVDGTLKLDFVPEQGDAVLSAIRIRPAA